MWLLLITSVFLPVVDGNWSAPEPVPPSVLKHSSAAVRIPDGGIREQTNFYRQIPDPLIRSRIAMVLRQANNPYAWGPVLELLKEEKNPSLQADLIGTLRILMEKEPVRITDVSFFEELLSSPVPAVRRDAAVILLRAGEGGRGIAAMLEKETLSFPAPVVLEKMAESSVRLTADEVTKLAASQNVFVRNSVLKYHAETAESPDDASLLKEAVKKAAEQKDIACAVSLAAGLAANKCRKCPALLTALTDALPDISVRLAAAGMPGISADRKDFLLRLLNDADPSVRAQAARSLRDAKYEDVTDALGKRLLDEDRLVREAAADSLAGLTGPKLPASALKAQENPKGYDPLLTVIAGTGNVEYAPCAARILSWAGREKKTELAEKAIRLLAALKAEKQASLILDLQDHESPEIREAVASVLYLFPGEAAVSALKRLAADKTEKVAIAAVESIRLLADPVFLPELKRELNNFSSRSFELRAYVCRALGSIPRQLDPSVATLLQRLILTPCVPMPMAPPAYDDSSVRGLATLLLLKAAQSGNAEYGKLLETVLRRLENPAPKEKEFGFDDSLMQEYVRQIRLMQAGKPVSPKEIPPSEPEYPVQKIK